MTRTSERFNRSKMTAAFLGGSALIAMGIIGATSSSVGGASAVVVSDGSMSTGETTTVTFTGTIAPVVAVPAVKAKPYGAA
jgi:hypothetical protein